MHGDGAQRDRGRKGHNLEPKSWMLRDCTMRYASRQSWTRKRSATELLGPKDSIEEHDTDLKWCNSDIQLVAGVTKKKKKSCWVVSLSYHEMETGCGPNVHVVKKTSAKRSEPIGWITESWKTNSQRRLDAVPLGGTWNPGQHWDRWTQKSWTCWQLQEEEL